LKLGGKRTDLIERLVQPLAEAEEKASAAFAVGEKVQALWDARQRLWQDAQVLKYLGKARYAIVWMSDGDDSEVGPGQVRKNPAEVDAEAPFQAGEAIVAPRAAGSSLWREGVLLADRGDGAFAVAWADGTEEAAFRPDVSRAQKFVPFKQASDFEVGQQLRGTVIAVSELGAYVDIGAGRPGFVHQKRMFEGGLKIGDEVEVEVAIVIPEDDRVSLALAPRPGQQRVKGQDVSSFAGISPYEWLVGEIRHVRPSGFIVEVRSPDGVRAQGLVHMTMIKDGVVENTADEGYEGKQVEVRVERVDAEFGKLGLSMRDP